MRELLLEALRRRLAEVRARAGDAVQAVPTEPAADPEETLRRVMVRLFPRVRDGRATAEDRRDYLASLHALASAAAGPDLRYLDAWNNGYEVLAGAAEPEVAAFVACYGALLEGHVAGLATHA